MYEINVKENTRQVDSFRFLDRSTKKLVQNWIKLESPRAIPWTAPTKPLIESRIALISSAGLALKSDPPFDQEGERRNPWWGDPSYRILPGSVTAEDVNLYHLHISPRVVEQDINTLFPVQRLMELEKQDEIGSSATNHFSYMGYILEPETLLKRSVPTIIEDLVEDEVDIVVLVPG